MFQTIKDSSPGAAIFNGIAGVNPLSTNELTFLLGCNNKQIPINAKMGVYRLAFKAFAKALHQDNELVIAAGMATQFVVESAYGTACTGKFNYSGIKDFDYTKKEGFEPGMRKLCSTTEYNLTSNQIALYKNRGHLLGSHKTGVGTEYTVLDYFRNYATFDDFVLDKIAVLNSKNFAKCMESTKVCGELKNGVYAPDKESYFDRVQAAGYATAPEYAKSLTKCLDDWNKLVYYNPSFYAYLVKTADVTVDKKIFVREVV